MLMLVTVLPSYKNRFSSKPFAHTKEPWFFPGAIYHLEDILAWIDAQKSTNTQNGTGVK